MYEPIAVKLLKSSYVDPVGFFRGRKDFVFPQNKPQMSAGRLGGARLILDYLAETTFSEQEFQRPHQHHLTSINAEIDHRNDGNVLIARELSDALLAKICWGILTRSNSIFWTCLPLLFVMYFIVNLSKNSSS
jgi:hypothetical protein